MGCNVWDTRQITSRFSPDVHGFIRHFAAGDHEMIAGLHNSIETARFAANLLGDGRFFLRIENGSDRKFDSR